MTARWKGLSLPVIFAVLALIPANLKAQHFVFTNDATISGSNSVTAFSVNPSTGALTLLGTTPTGGTSDACSYFGAQSIVTSPNGNFVYATDCQSGDVAAFHVNKTTGALTLLGRFGTGAPGSTSGGLAITPLGNLLFASSGGGAQNVVTTFSVALNGTLTSLGQTVLPGFPDGIAVQTGGNFLAVALVNLGKIAVYNIGLGGRLSAVPGSPFTAPGPTVTGVTFNCGSPSLLFAGLLGSELDTFDVASNGALSATPSSPFAFSGTAFQTVLYDFRDQVLFTADYDGAVDDFKVDMMGNLTPGPNSPFTLAGGVSQLGGMALAILPITSGGVARPTATVFVPSPFGNVSVLIVASNGTFHEVAGSPFSTGVGGNSALVGLTTDPSSPCGTSTFPLF